MTDNPFTIIVYMLAVTLATILNTRIGLLFAGCFTIWVMLRLSGAIHD